MTNIMGNNTNGQTDITIIDGQTDINNTNSYIDVNNINGHFDVNNMNGRISYVEAKVCIHIFDNIQSQTFIYKFNKIFSIKKNCRFFRLNYSTICIFLFILKIYY